MTNPNEGIPTGDQTQRVEPESIQTPQEATHTLESTLSPEEQVLILVLKEAGLENNQAFLEFVTTKETELDLINEPHKSARARERFDIRKAVIIGLAGDLNYAYELLAFVGQMAQQTGNDALEDEVDAALTGLGL
jgi:hypothetical protein